MSDLVGTPAQVADRLECGEKKVWQLINGGQMPHVRLGPHTIRVVWAELEQWLADESRASTVLYELEADGADIPGMSTRRQGAA